MQNNEVKPHDGCLVSIYYTITSTSITVNEKYKLQQLEHFTKLLNISYIAEKLWPGIMCTRPVVWDSYISSFLVYTVYGYHISPAGGTAAAGELCVAFVMFRAEINACEENG